MDVLRERARTMTIPLVLVGDRPGNEIQAPMGVVILGGLLSSTALKMLVVPALYARFAKPRAVELLEEISPQP